MRVITLQAFYKGRDIQNREELTDEIRENAVDVVGRVNDLLQRANLKSISAVSSGWRPKGVNDATANAAKGSKHLTGQAVDIADPDRTLAGWCADNTDVLDDVGLWIESPQYTPTWVHFQSVPPKSGRRIFIPNSSPPLDPSFPITWA